MHTYKYHNKDEAVNHSLPTISEAKAFQMLFLLLKTNGKRISTVERAYGFYRAQGEGTGEVNLGTLP